MIEFEDVRIAYKDKPVLDGVSLTIHDREFFVLIGSSGCGKTTLLSLLLGLEQPDSGRVLGMEGRRKSAVFQEDRLCENAGAVSNLRLVNPTLTREEAEAMLRDLGLGDSLRQPVRTLSGGMKRRVAILRALCAPYDVLFCDEPFKGLDEGTKGRAMEYFQKRTQGRTVILVTHEKNEANFLKGQLLLL